MNRIDKGRLLFTSLLFAVAVVFALLAAGYEPKARLIPLAVSISAILLGLPLLISELFPGRTTGGDTLKKTGFSAESSQSRTGQPSQAAGLPKILLWMSGFLVLIFLLGFYIGILFFSFAYLKVQARIGWPKALLVSGGLWFFIFFIFGKGMELDLFKGILMGEILPPL